MVHRSVSWTKPKTARTCCHLPTKYIAVEPAPVPRHQLQMPVPIAGAEILKQQLSANINVKAVHRVRKKKRPEFFRHNFNKCRHSFVIFGMNHPKDSFYQESGKFIPNIITSLRGDDVIVIRDVIRNDVITHCLRKRYNNILSNNFKKIKRIVVIFARQHQ